MTPGEFRLRVCYRKAGRLRYLSHLEVAHALQRGIRRARLPYAVTQGYHPHMKAAFGPALPVGTASEREYLDLWMTRYTDPDDLLASLRAVAPPGLEPIEARFVSDAEPSLTAALVIASYRVVLEGGSLTAAQVHEGLSRVLASGTFELERKGKLKVFDLAHCIPKEPCVTDREDGVDVDISVRIGADGSLRPDVLVRAAVGIDTLGAVSMRTTRLDTFLEREEGVWSRPV